MFEPVKNNSNKETSTIVKYGKDGNFEFIKRFGGWDLDRRRPYNAFRPGSVDHEEDCQIIVSNKQKYIPLKERTRIIEDLDIKDRNIDDVLNGLLRIIGEKQFADYFK